MLEARWNLLIGDLVEGFYSTDRPAHTLSELIVISTGVGGLLVKEVLVHSLCHRLIGLAACYCGLLSVPAAPGGAGAGGGETSRGLLLSVTRTVFNAS